MADKTEEKDFFCWSANLLTFKRRKAVVVVNDSNRFGFVLYGLKSKDFKQFDKLIAEGIRTCLRDERIKEEIIEKYFAQSKEFVFTKTRGRIPVARLNKACEVVEILADRLDVSSVYQADLSGIINRDLFKPGKDKDYMHPYELLIEDFEEYYGDKIIQSEAADLLVKLDLGAYSASRRLIVPMGVTFKDLHEIIQIAFGWQDRHLHDFKVFDEKGNCLLNVISEFEEVFESLQDCPVLRYTEITADVYIRNKNRMVYTYDYGDDWKHEISVQRVISDYEKNYPVCIMAEGNRPPEDVGGIPGYEEYLEIINNPDHPEYKNMKRWAESQWYKDFDIDAANRRLRYLK
ncbi:MAG: plasmid pRiA4b ORF-3 family protein [Clostridiaceae bacterium]